MHDCAWSERNRLLIAFEGIYIWNNSICIIFAGAAEKEKSSAMKKSKSSERSRYENSCYADDDEDNIVFEDFARLRLNEPDE